MDIRQAIYAKLHNVSPAELKVIIGSKDELLQQLSQLLK